MVLNSIELEALQPLSFLQEANYRRKKLFTQYLALSITLDRYILGVFQKISRLKKFESLNDPTNFAFALIILYYY